MLSKGDGASPKKGLRGVEGAWALSSFQAIDPTNREPFSPLLPLNK